MLAHGRLGLAGLLLAALAGAAVAGPAAEMSSSVIVFYNSDFRPIYFPTSLCSLLLNRIKKESGSRSVNIVPTAYWYDKSNENLPQGTCDPDRWAKTDQKVDYFCMKDVWDSPCLPFTPDTISQFKEGIKGCLKEAFSLFDEVLISPHLDDGLKTGHWRNMLHFDPLKKDPYGNSYQDIMINPILESINEVAPQGKTFWFGMQGEMGGTVFSYPQSYIKMAKDIRARYTGGAKLKVGTLFNHAYLYGHINRLPALKGPLPPSKMSKFDGGFGQVLPLLLWPDSKNLRNNLAAIKELLYKQVDFFGISNYARAPENVQPKHIESALDKMNDEFTHMGISIQDLTRKHGKTLFMNEFAIGGGISECGDTVARNAKDAGEYPWLGITTPYTGPDKDPWKATPVVRDYMIRYYKAALKLLSTGGIKYKVSGAFLWNIVSWDLQGIHTASALWGQDPFKAGFGDVQATNLIKSYNKGVVAAKMAAKAKGKPASPSG